MKYTIPRLVKSDPKDWYVYYSYFNPETGKKKPFKHRGDINNLTGKARTEYGNKLAADIKAELDAGFVPPGIKGTEQDIKDRNRLNFYWWFDEKIKNEKSRGDAGYYNWKNVTQVKKRLVEFRPELSINDLDYKLLKDFETYLLDKGSSINNILFIMNKIKAVVSTILKSGDLPYHKNPFHSYKPRKTPVKTKRITFVEFLKLRDVELTNPDEILARDMYAFSFYHAGMRFGDICRVKKSWFSKNRTTYTMNKAKNERNLKIVPEANKIIEKYINSPGEYLFDCKVNWDEASKSIDIKNTYYNKKLKRACKEAKIPEITFHTSRHSVADLAVSKDMDVRTIKELLGHSKLATTERYLKRFNKEKTDEAMDKLFAENQ